MHFKKWQIQKKISGHVVLTTALHIDHHVPHLLSPYYHHQNGHCVEDLNHHTHTTQNSDHQLPTQQVSGLLALYD